jgi:23S rRNA pseudouridine2605 synthase
VLETGLKRQIRMMFLALGYQVQKLVRVRVGSLELDDLPLGGWRPLDAKEISRLQVNPKPKAARRPGVKPAKKAAKKTTRQSVISDRSKPAAKTSRRPTADSRPTSARKTAKKTAKRTPKRKF